MNGTKTDLSALSLFAAVARNRSFRKAAIELAMPVATLSRKISNLEEVLGTQLLQRTTRSVVLTEVGEQLLNDIAEPLTKLNKATRRAVHQQDSTSGIVKIATTYTLAETSILPVLPKIRQTWPDIKIQLLLSEEVIDIRSKRVDFAVRAGKLKDLSLISRKLCTHHLIRYCTPEIQNSKEAGLISYSDEFLHPEPANIEVKDMRLVLQLVLAGQGEAWMPNALCMEYEKRGKLIRIDDARVYASDIFLVFGSKKFVPKRVRLVMDEVIEHAHKFTKEAQVA
ncbi:MAG: LysR family transcriptional regulator [Devosiaceae bacterium]|nr:LysR family transcriptional regulator [Devosiaceae bacterium]